MIFYKNNILNNLLFSISTLLFTVSSFAQLYIAPSGNLEEDSSYIYVKDEVLFVTEDINLTENPTGATEASIYLRDEAQLIQGDDIANSGTGYISILQNNPGSDAWDYTYWGSPVGDQTLDTSGNQNFGVLRFFSPLGPKDGDCDCYLGTDSDVNTPINTYNGVQSPMQISNRWLYTYTNATWTRINDNPLVLPGRGFTMKGLGDASDMSFDDDQTYDFRGRPNNGDIDTPILASANSLSGNPYPSALDLNKVFHDNGNIHSFRFWDENRTNDGHFYTDNQGGYGVWLPMTGSYDDTGLLLGEYTVAPFWNYDSGGGQGSQDGEGEEYERRFAPVGQGFMIYGSSTGTVTYDNSQRVHVVESSGTSDFRMFSGDSEETSPNSDENYRIPHLRLNTYFNESHMRQLVLAFSDESTDGPDRGFDALSPMDSTSDVYFPIGEEQVKFPYVIQTVPFDIKKQIPYTIELEEQSRLVITAAEEVNFSHPAYLFDNVERTFQEITNEHAADLNLPAGLYENRFFITFVNLSTTQGLAGQSAKNLLLEEIDFFQNNPSQQLEIRNPEGYNIASANIFGMSGKLVFTASNLGNNNRFTFSTGHLSDGIYLVMLTTVDNIAVNYKITVSN